MILFIIATLTTTLAGTNAVQHFVNPPKIIGLERFTKEFLEKSPAGTKPEAAKEGYEQYKEAVRGRARFALVVSVAIAMVNAMHMFAMVFYLRRDDEDILSKSAMYSLVPGISPGIVLGIPFAIWVRVLLNKKS